MARGKIIDDKNLCPKCLCPTIMLQTRKSNLWRCVNPLCKKSPEGGGYFGTDKRIPVERVNFLVDLIELDIPRKGEFEFKKEEKRYLK